MDRKINHPDSTPAQDKNSAHIRHRRSGSGKSDSPRSDMQPRSYRDRHEPPSPTPTRRMAKSAATIGEGASTTQHSTGQNATPKQASGTASVDNASFMPPTDSSAPPKLTAGFDVSAPDSRNLAASPASTAPPASVPAVRQPSHLDKLTVKAARLFSNKCQKCGLANCENVGLGSSIPCVEKNPSYLELVRLLPEQIATMCLDDVVQNCLGAEQIFARHTTRYVQSRSVPTKDQTSRFGHFRDIGAWDPTSNEFKDFPTRIHSREELASLSPRSKPNPNAPFERAREEDARLENLHKEKKEKENQAAKDRAAKEMMKAKALGHSGSLVINYKYSQQGPYGKGEEAEDNGKRWDCCNASEFERCGL
ncbi:hypothetical protein B0T24DRAFT_697203 [Lasiosphaeria ovina]|uniref:Uncharacterized protein n=1 Tax=Lasiosphaeria ovina TaxID=92902 RepID=A0AAE0NFP9_9PEZI|nr:hypothetical protein B0T24DRAFT_697203 [Lasiosphaeria ovina]